MSFDVNSSSTPVRRLLPSCSSKPNEDISDQTIKSETLVTPNLTYKFAGRSRDDVKTPETMHRINTPHTPTPFKIALAEAGRKMGVKHLVSYSLKLSTCIYYTNVLYFVLLGSISICFN